VTDEAVTSLHPVTSPDPIGLEAAEDAAPTAGAAHVDGEPQVRQNFQSLSTPAPHIVQVWVVPCGVSTGPA
jgi:hypothetical protein